MVRAIRLIGPPPLPDIRENLCNSATRRTASLAMRLRGTDVLPVVAPAPTGEPALFC